MLAARVAKLVALRRAARADRKVAMVLFNFPPNAGTTGTAAYLSVFASLLNTLHAMKDAGYQVELPDDAWTICATRILHGNAPALRHRRQCGGAHPRRRPCAPRAASGRDRAHLGPGAGPAAIPTAARSSCSARSSATCSSACSPASATRATRCGCCSSAASRRRMRSTPSTAGCARISAPMRCCISAPMARWSSCRASRPGCPAPAGRTG